MENLKNDLVDLVNQMEMGKCSDSEVVKVLNNIVSYYDKKHSPILIKEKFQLIADLIQTRINDLTDRLDPSNEENDQELIDATSEEILELSFFLAAYYKED